MNMVGANSVVLSRLVIGSEVIIPAGRVIDFNVDDRALSKGQSERSL
jgi:hypothetical protein